MHLLATRPGGYHEETTVVTLGQTPADIVILSAADTDLSLLAEQYGKHCDGTGYPSLRLANLGLLRNPATIDLYVDEVVRHARLVIASLLGGAAYWPYLCEQLAAMARAGGPALALVPGDDQPDPELAALATVAPHQAHRIWRYLREGGPGNARALLGFVGAAFFGRNDDYAEPRALPGTLLYHPQHAPATLADWRREWRPGAPVAALLFYRAHLQAANTAVIDALCEALREAGCNPLPVALNSLKEPQCLDIVNALLEEAAAEIILNTTAFGVRSPHDPAPHRQERSPIKRDVPVIQVILSGGQREDWQADTQGLSPRDLAMNVALPEVDGRIIGRAVSFKGLIEHNAATQSDRIGYRPHPERVAWCARLARNWCELGRRPNRDKRVALILANYPTREGRIGNGVGLDTPQSVVRILETLAAAGFPLSETPADGDALMRVLLQGATNDLDASGARPALRGLRLAAYRAWFATLPATSQAEVIQRWGAPEEDPALRDGCFPVAGRCFGRTFVGIQPARGYHLDPYASYHDPDLVPPHNYLAFYGWLREHYGADAIVHTGKHGNLEWLPGKSVALSHTCWPDLVLGPLPHIYPFIVNDPGEGSQAKRRAQAVIIDHLVPPLTRAETYGPLAELELQVDEYYEALNMDPRRARVLREAILEALVRHNLDRELGGGSGEGGEGGEGGKGGKGGDPERLLQRLDGYLCELKESQIRDGLHIFGVSPAARQRTDTLLALARLPRGDGEGPNAGLLGALARDFGLDCETDTAPPFDPLDHDPAAPWRGARPAALAAVTEQPWRSTGDTRERLELYAHALIDNPARAEEGLTHGGAVLRQIKEQLAPALDACGARELGGLQDALEGRFVAPGPSGAPSRGRPEVLPTGRNFYSVDVRAIPTPTAWRLGFHAASLLIERYMQDHGDYPRTLGISAWGTATMRTGGDDIAQALALLGVQPSWAHGSSRVTGFEILPVSVLGRPRVDVTLRVSGFFRDAFYNVIDLFDAAVQAVAELDEPPQDNPLRARVRTETEHHIARGETPEQARREAGWRVFGAKPGAYGAGLQGPIDERCWETRADLARAYLAWGGYAYDREHRGAPAMAAFRERLGHLQAVLHNQDNREHDLLDSDDYYQFQGGMAAAAETFGGVPVAIYHGDHAQPAAPRVRSLKEEINRVIRSRVVNPKWIEGMRRHGYKGAFEMAATVDYLFAYDATTGVVADYQYALVADAYLLDPANRAFIERHNRNALHEISERLLEAMERGLWAEPGEYRQRIEDGLLEAEERLEGGGAG